MVHFIPPADDWHWALRMLTETARPWSHSKCWASLVAQWQRICLPMQETWFPSLGAEDPLEKKLATHSSILTWEIPWTEELGGLQSMGLQRVGMTE